MKNFRQALVKALLKKVDNVMLLSPDDFFANNIDNDIYCADQKTGMFISFDL